LGGHAGLVQEIRRSGLTVCCALRWFRPAEFQIAMLGAKLWAENQISTLLFASNPAGKDEVTSEQIRVFENAVRHVNRAIYFHRELRLRELDHDTAPERLEHLPHGVMLVDGTSRLFMRMPRPASCSAPAAVLPSKPAAFTAPMVWTRYKG
jgi:hypothetical protein